MLAKYFDCLLDDGHPTVRVLVEVPESAAEALAMVDTKHLDSLNAVVPDNDPGKNLALAHEEARVALLEKMIAAQEATWDRDHAHLDEDDPEKQAKFADAFPALFEAENFAGRFAKEDAKAEYFRLYGIVSSCAAFTAVEVDPKDKPAPAAEHKNWTKIRKQVGSIGTERKPDSRAALVALVAKPAPAQPKQA